MNIVQQAILFIYSGDFYEKEEKETEPQTEVPVITTPLSYAEKCELDYVEPPVKRTREEAVEKIKELSRWFPALYQVYLNEEKYPLELLLSGAGNPEMTDYLYGYLASDGSTNGYFEDYEQPEDYPLFLQWDTRWGYMPYGSNGTVGSSGCGPACLSMAVFCSVRPGDFTSEGHFIVIYGYDDNGYKINDPKCVYRSRLSWTYDQIQDDIKRIWSVGK